MFSQGPSRPTRRLSTALQGTPPGGNDGSQPPIGLVRTTSLLAEKVVVHGNLQSGHDAIPHNAQPPNPDHHGVHSGLHHGQGQRAVDLKALLKTSRLEDVLFSLAYLITKENDLPPKITWLFIIIEDVQWLSFPYSAYLHKDLPDWLGTVLDPLRAVPDYQAFSIANIISLLIVFGVIFLIGVVLTLMHRQAKVPIFALRLLRVLTALIMTALSIPIATFLMMGLHCSDGKMKKFYVECFSGPHLGLFVLNILGLVAFVPLLMLAVTLFIDTSPTSPSPVAKAHSRADTIDVLLRLILVLFDVLAYKATDTFHYAFMAVAAVTLAYLANHLAHTQPYYSSAMTAFRSAMCLSTSFTMIASFFIRALVGYDTRGWWIVMVPASIVGFIAGILQARYYSRKFLKLKIQYWHRILKEEAAEAEQAMKSSEASLPSLHGSIRPSSSPPASSTPATQPAARSPLLPRRTMSRGGRGSPLKMTLDTPSTDSLGNPQDNPHGAGVESVLPNRRDPESLKSAPVLSATIPRILDSHLMLDSAAHSPPPSSKTTSRHKSALALPSPQETEDIITSVIRGTSKDALNLVKERRPPKRVNVFDSPLEVELCIRFIRENPTKKQIAIGLQLLERGLYEFPADPLLYLLAATYMAAYYGSKGERVADQLMKELEQSRNSVPLDVKFLAYCNGRSKQDQGTHVLDRVAHDSLQREVKLHHLRALTTVRDVWEAIRTGAGAGRLAALTSKLAFHHRSAAKCYNVLLARSQRDQQTLRMFAQFIALVEADNVRAQALLDLADDLEAAEMRQGGNLDVDGGQQASRSNSNLDVSSPVHNQHQDQFILGSDPTAALFASEDYDPTDSGPSATTDSRHKAKQAFGRSAQHLHRSPSQHGSQTSGSSTTSRTQRFRIQMRRVMLERLTRPLKGAWWVGLCVFLFLAAVVTGFVLCMNFTTVSESKLTVEFSATRDGRRNVLNIVEGIRRMYYGNLIRDRDEFARGLKQLQTRHAELVKDILPVINPIDATHHERLPRAKLYSRNIVNGTRQDYIPTIVTPVELANTIAQTGALVLGYSQFGALTTEHFTNISSLRFISDNFFEIFDAVRALPSIGLQLHAELAQKVTLSIAIVLGVSLLLLGVLGVVLVLAVFRRYFTQELKVHSLLVAFPKRAAANLLVDIEEELESFREITQNDELEDGDLGGVIGDSHSETGDSGGSSGQTAKVGSSPGAARQTKRRAAKYYVSLALAFTVISTCVTALFSYTLSAIHSVNKEADMLIQSADRRYFLNGLAMSGREFVSPDWSIPSTAILQNFRTYIQEADELHSALVEDPDGLSAVLPRLTILPRDCVSATNPDPTCASIRFAPEVGFTKDTASVPLNTEFTRMLDLARELASYFLESNARQVFRSSHEAMQGWQLLELLIDDLRPRHNQVDLALTSKVVENKRQSQAVIVIIFVMVIISSVAAFVALIVFGIRRLRNEAAVLVMLLSMVPQGMLKEHPELAQFIETGGLQLLTS